MFYYLIMLLLLVCIELLYFRIAERYRIIDNPTHRSSHTRVTLRGGGILFYIGALVYFIDNGFDYLWFMLGLTLITLISMIDDIHPVSQKVRLIFHFLAMGLMFYEWGLFDYSYWVMILALIICTGIINAYNFMDGINGITGGYSLVLFCTLLYVNEQIVLFVDSKLIVTMIVSVSVFCFFNFRKKAVCFAGDVGSISIAFIVLFLLGRLISATGDFSWIVLLAVYGIDSTLTIIHRIMLHENIGLPHRKHMYQLMANELRIPHTVVAALYMIVQLQVIVIYLICPGYPTLAVICTLLMMYYVFFMNKYYHLHGDNK